MTLLFAAPLLSRRHQVEQAPEIWNHALLHFPARWSPSRRRVSNSQSTKQPPPPQDTATDGCMPPATSSMASCPGHPSTLKLHPRVVQWSTAVMQPTSQLSQPPSRILTIIPFFKPPRSAFHRGQGKISRVCLLFDLKLRADSEVLPDPRDDDISLVSGLLPWETRFW
jgi:hypothetical protein